MTKLSDIESRYIATGFHRFVLDQDGQRPNGPGETMKKPGFGAVKAFLALSSAGRGRGHVDWLLVVALWSSIITVVVIVLYVVQRGS
jgi:hypothetical protein